jgi:hypothetical protein
MRSSGDGRAVKIASQAVGLHFPRQNRRDFHHRARDLLYSAADPRAPQVDKGLRDLVRDLCLRKPSHLCNPLAAVALTRLPTGPWKRGVGAPLGGDRLMDKRGGDHPQHRGPLGGARPCLSW